VGAWANWRKGKK